VLHAIAGEDLGVPVVHRDGEVHGPLPLRHAQDRARLGCQIDVLGGAVELEQRGFERVRRRRSGFASRVGHGHR
jgi:hypothetical protein